MQHFFDLNYIRFLGAQILFIIRVSNENGIIPIVELENFMLCNDGYLKIGVPIDCLARVVQTTLDKGTKPIDYCGIKFFYSRSFIDSSAPEILGGNMPSYSSNYWSFGVILYVLSTAGGNIHVIENFLLNFQVPLHR